MPYLRNLPNAFMKIVALCMLSIMLSCNYKGTNKNSVSKVETRDSLIVDFIPITYEIMDSIRGDLNGDAFSDVLLLLRNETEIESNENLNRPLLILLGTATGYRLGAISQTAVYCFLCGGVMGDPYTGMKIDSSGTFSINHYGGSNWRWTRNLTFRFDVEANDWFLLQDVSESFSVFEEDSVEVDTKTPIEFGRLSFSQFDIYKE